MEAWRLTQSTGSGPKPLHSRLKLLDSTHPSGEGSAAIIVYFQHAAKTLSREMPFSQQQPVVAATCFTSRPPVFTKHCCKLVSDQLLTFRGSPSRRHRLPGGGSPGNGISPSMQYGTVPHFAAAALPNSNLQGKPGIHAGCAHLTSQVDGEDRDCASPGRRVHAIHEAQHLHAGFLRREALAHEVNNADAGAVVCHQVAVAGCRGRPGVIVGEDAAADQG